MDPATTTGTLSRESNVVPPGSHQWIMNPPAKRFESEIDRLQILSATCVWTASFSIHDVRGHHAVGSSLAIDFVHRLRGRSTHIGNHACHIGGLQRSAIPSISRCASSLNFLS